MSINVLSACLLLAIAAVGFYFINNALEPAREHLEAPRLGGTPSAGQGPAVAGAPKEELATVGDGLNENPFYLDVDASSSSVDNDPRILALAEAAGKSPRCAAEALRAADELIEYMETNPGFDPVSQEYEYANPISEECKQELSRMREPPPPYEVNNPAYEQYSDEQLEAMAPYEADAAVLLARRVEDDKTSRAYYELATQVTQDATPLNEWLHSRESAFVPRINDVLDVDSVMLAYETALIAEAFGSDLDMARRYREELHKERVDTSAAEGSARERIAALKGEQLIVLYSDSEKSWLDWRAEMIAAQRS